MNGAIGYGESGRGFYPTERFETVRTVSCATSPTGLRYSGTGVREMRYRACSSYCYTLHHSKCVCGNSYGTFECQTTVTFFLLILHTLERNLRLTQTR